MKRIFAFLTATLLSLTLAACQAPSSAAPTADASSADAPSASPVASAGAAETIRTNGLLVTTKDILVNESGNYPSVIIPACAFTYPPDGTKAWVLENELTISGNDNSVFQFVIFDLTKKTLSLGERPSTTDIKENQLALFLFYNRHAYPLDVSRDCLSYSGGGAAHVESNAARSGHTFMADYFAPMFNRDSAQPPFKIVLGGDSITMGAHGSGYAQDGDVIIDQYRRNPNGHCWANLFKDYIERNYHATVTNNAVNGTYSQWWDERKAVLIPADTDLLILTLGPNERMRSEKIGFTREEQIAQFYAHLKSIIDYCHAQGTKVLLCSSIPASRANEEKLDDTDAPLYPSHTYDFVGVEQRLASEYDMDWFNLYNAIYYRYLDAGIDYDSMLSDGLHPGDELYTTMFYEYLRGFGLAPSVGASDF